VFNKHGKSSTSLAQESI